MKVIIDGYIENNIIHGNGDFHITGYYDPNGLVEKHDKETVVVVLEIKISKKGNLVALVRDIRNA